LKILWLQFVESYLKIGFQFYYKSIRAYYSEKIPKDKAVLFLSNHQNALLDPLLISVNSTRKNFFLTRAKVFSNPIVARVLNSLQMLPVYRMVDGINTIQKNKEIFSICSELLHKKQSIIMFPEGSHSLNRSVRPLSKGFTRIIEETLQKYPETKIVIIPIGVNYQDPIAYGDSMSIYFGKHIDPLDYYQENVLDVPKLKDAVSNEIKKLTTHIKPGLEYENTLTNLKDLKVDFTNPTEINKYLEHDVNYTGKQVRANSTLFTFLKTCIIIIYSIPYLIWKKVAAPKVKELEFMSTFRYTLVITLAPIFLIIEVAILTLLFGKTIGLTVLAIGVLLPFVALRVK